MHIPATKVLIPAAGGGTTLAISFDVSHAPVPQRRYTADVAWVEYREPIVKMMFAQQRVDGENLRSLIVLHMTTEATRRFVESCESFTPTVKLVVERSGGHASPLVRPSREPEQTVALTCNAIAGALAQGEVCMDCYHVPPFAARDSVDHDELEIEAVVRLSLPSSLALSVLEELGSIVDRLPEPHDDL